MILHAFSLYSCACVCWWVCWWGVTGERPCLGPCVGGVEVVQSHILDHFLLLMHVALGQRYVLVRLQVVLGRIGIAPTHPLWPATQYTHTAMQREMEPEAFTQSQTQKGRGMDTHCISHRGSCPGMCSGWMETCSRTSHQDNCGEPCRSEHLCVFSMCYVSACT
jgi:hypothetical protein